MASPRRKLPESTGTDIQAFDPDGKLIGNFPNQPAAALALNEFVGGDNPSDNPSDERGRV